VSEVVCVGIVVVDALGKPVKEFPEKGKLVVVDTLTLATGGCAVNTGIALSRMGTSVSVIGKIGDDAFGKFLIDQMQKSGVDASGVKVDKNVSTSFTYVAVFEDGERAFFHTLGGSAALHIDDIDMSIVKKAKIVHVAGSYVMSTFDGEQTTQFLTWAKREGLITSLDTVYNDKIEDWLAVIEPSLPHIDYFLPSIIEASKISGRRNPEDIASFLIDKGVGVVALKMGLEGVYVMSKEEAFHVPIYKVDTVDATGAGDAFVAGFLRGVLEGWNMEECAKLGNATAAFCVQAIGCTTGVRSLDEIMEFQKNYDR